MTRAGGLDCWDRGVGRPLWGCWFLCSPSLTPSCSLQRIRGCCRGCGSPLPFLEAQAPPNQPPRSSLSVGQGTVLSLNRCCSLLAFSEEGIKCRKEPRQPRVLPLRWGVEGWGCRGRGVGERAVFCNEVLAVVPGRLPSCAWCKRWLTIS